MRTKTNSSQSATSVGLMVLGLAGVISFSFFPSSHAQNNSKVGPCRPQGAVQGCSAKGKPGEQVCDGGVWTVCVANRPVPKRPAPVSGTIAPKYMVLTVVYAPPGTNGGKGSSLVKYGSGSTVGSTVSVSDAFKQGIAIAVTAEGTVPGFTLQSEVNFGVTVSSTNSQSLEITQANTTEINDPGPPADGIDHDYDLIYLALSPTVQLKLFPTASGTVPSAAWSLVNLPQTAVTYVYAGWMRNPSTMGKPVRDFLQNHGITSQDYADILKADPYGNSSLLPADSRLASVLGGRAPDPRRFLLFANLPYEPPFSAADADKVPTIQKVLAFSSTGTSSTTAQNEYTVGLKLQSQGGFLDLEKLTLKNELNWTWTNSATNSSSNVSTQTATLIMGGPAFGYQGNFIEVGVYYDLIYKTFLFVPIPSTSQPVFGGVLVTNGGKPVAGKEVVVVGANGARYQTFTNAKGQYHVFCNIIPPVRVQVGAMTRALPQLPATRKVDLVLPR